MTNNKSKVDNDVKFFELLAHENKFFKVTYDLTFLYIVGTDDKQDIVIDVKNIQTVFFLSDLVNQIRVKFVLKDSSLYINLSKGYINVSL